MDHIRPTFEIRGDMSILAHYPMRRLRHDKIEYLTDRLVANLEEGVPYDEEVLWEVIWRATVAEHPFIPAENHWFDITSQILTLIREDPDLAAAFCAALAEPQRFED